MTVSPVISSKEMKTNGLKRDRNRSASFRLKPSYYQCSFTKNRLIPQSSTVVEFWRTPIQYNNENTIPQYSAADCEIMKNAPAMCNSTGDVQKAGEEYVV